MNLPELIRLNDALQSLTLDDLQTQSSHRFDYMLQKFQEPESIDKEFYSQLVEKNQRLHSTFGDLQQELHALKEEIKQQIVLQGNAWFQKSLALYERQVDSADAQRPEAVGYHRNKPLSLDPELLTNFRARVAAHCTWHHPAMIIHPMLEPFVQDMTPSDPLYLVDESSYLLEPVLQQFNETYRNRLCVYTIKESFDEPILTSLPKGQLGFCLIYNYLNYRPFELIKKYLNELYAKMLPGGVVAFTFNDCDKPQAIQMVEQNITCYTPGSLIRAWAKYIGFEEIWMHQDNSASVWLEVKKPGTLKSLRGGQALAKILPKPIAESK